MIQGGRQDAMSAAVNVSIAGLCSPGLAQRVIPPPGEQAQWPGMRAWWQIVRRHPKRILQGVGFAGVFLSCGETSCKRLEKQNWERSLCNDY